MTGPYYKHRIKKQIVQTLSRENVSVIYYGSEDSHHALQFADGDWKYKVELTLKQLSRKKAPKPDSVTIRCSKQGIEKKVKTFIPGNTDRARFFELVYLLAAKLKYDLLNGKQYDNSGFLLSQEIIRLNENDLTHVQKALNHTLGRLYRKSKNQKSPVWRNFLGSIFIHPDQMWHLINRLGKSGGVAKDQRYVWWLNIDPGSVSFKDTSGKIINDNILKKCLSLLFPARCLYKVKEWQELNNIIEIGPRYIGHQFETGTTAEVTEKQPTDPYKEMEYVLKKVLKDQAFEALYQKLNSNDKNAYHQLELEYGTIKSNAGRFQADLDPMQNTESDHNRKWKDFNLEILHKPFGYFILSSDVGAGKTTFLRHFQSFLLEKDLFIPIYITAKQIEELNSFCFTDIIRAVAKRLNIEENISLISYFEEAIKRQKIVWLIDGLDQISGMGTAYKCLIKDILNVINNNIIISSRPTAVVSEETNKKATFLRLKPFSKVIQQHYFGINYERAQRLCKNCPEITGIPMLAYMVRELIENKKDIQISNRSQLYQRFINHIFKKYFHEQLRISKHLELHILRNLEKISYEAFNNKLPYIQKIPLEFAYDHIDKITVDDLTRHGVVNLIIDRTCDNLDILYFSHQSYQEFLAAKWATKSKERTDYILSKMWNPKWKEVIKFLTGLLGEKFIEQIYSPNCTDDCIHSRLFLAAECYNEVGKTIGIEKKLITELVRMTNVVPFESDAISAISKLDMPVAIDCLVDIACGNPQDEVIRILASKANKLSKRHSDKIIKLFTMSSNYYIDWIKSIIKFLSSSKQFNTQHIEQMIDISCKSNDNTRRIPILQYIFPIMLPSHLNRIFNYLKNCNQNERENAISILDYLVSNRKLDDERIVELFDILRQATPDIQRDILEVVRTSMKKGSFLSPVQINVVIEMLKSSSKDISKISADIIISCANKNKLLQQPEKLIMTLFEGTEEQVEIAIYLSENIFSKPDNQCISKIIEIFYKSDKANLRLKALFALESILDEQLFNVIDINLIIDLLKVETRLFRSDSYIESLQDSSINILYSQRSKLHQQDVDKIINCLSRLEKCLDKIPLPDKLSPCQMERIQNLLENGNEYTQINIIRFLCRHNVKKLVEQEDTLIKLLYRENPSVVLSAFYFLKKLGKYRLPSLVDAAMNCIKHIDIRVQAEAADFLSQVELSDTNNDKILAFLQSKRISMWRTQNLWRLTIDRVPSESLIEVLIFLNNCISVSSSSIVRELTKRLCSRLTSKHIQKMIDYLETEDRNLHLQVAKTIREISRYYRHFSASQVNKIICAINRLKFVDSDWYMFCFPAISGYATNEFVHKIITMFVKNPENQFIHDTMLSHIPSKLLINQVSLIVSLLETKSSEVKVGLLEVLYQITTELEPSHIEKIVCLLNGYDESVSRSAYRLLQKVHKQKGLTI